MSEFDEAWAEFMKQLRSSDLFKAIFYIWLGMAIMLVVIEVMK